MLKNMFSPVLMTILTSNVLIIITALCFKYTRLMLQVGYKVLGFVITLIIVRFLFPVELSISQNIILPQSISFIISRVRWNCLVWKGMSLSPWIIFCWVWLAVAAVLIFHYVCCYWHCKVQIERQGIFLTKQAPVCEMLNRICQEQGKKNCFQVVEYAGVTIPCLFGIMRPYILLPKAYQLSEADLYIVLRHETAHHFHHDLLLKATLKMITLVYWWNPIGWLLNNQTDVLLDMRIDEKLTSRGNAIKREYLNCLLRIADASVDTKNETSSAFVISMCKDSGLIKKRFVMMTKKRGKSYFAGVLALFVSIGIFCFSYSYTFEMRYLTPEMEQYTIPSEHGYLVLNSDNKYDLYAYGYYIGTVDNPQSYPQLKIYKEGDVINEK